MSKDQATAAKTVDGLKAFLDKSPTPYHAVANMASQLTASGFSQIHEQDAWKLKDGGKHYVIRGGGSIIAFALGKGDVAQTGVRIVGAHTDSPCIKVKPSPDTVYENYFSLAADIYGGALLSTWFDRDLSLAGRVLFTDRSGILRDVLVDFERPVALIPNLAIHLNREVNENRSINNQVEMLPVMAQWNSGDPPPRFREILRAELHRTGNKQVADVLEYDLSLYDTCGAGRVGLSGEFLTSARLDNLLSCYVGLMSLTAASEFPQTGLLAAMDHEEIGSRSYSGADGSFLADVLSRIAGDSTDRYARLRSRSLMVSADNAHGVHPNYPDKHDKRHLPLLNGGVVIKFNANQSYSSSSVTASKFADLCAQISVPVQKFSMRNDMRCGSTIGPITSALIGVPAVDVGVPTFAMHSIRETAGTADVYHLYRVLSHFYAHVPKSQI